MPLNSVMLVALRRRNLAEWVATMETRGTGDPSGFCGERIVESFGQPQIYPRFLSDGDLRPELAAQHRGSARFVLTQVTAGSPGSFTVDQRGQFIDYHGGHGFRRGDCLNWFTPDALDRGIGWFFVQTYRHGTRVVGRYNLIRIISARSGVEVRKVRL